MRTSTRFFPLIALIELEKEGIIGRLSKTHFSFSYVNDVFTLATQTAPEVYPAAHGG